MRSSSDRAAIEITSAVPHDVTQGAAPEKRTLAVSRAMLLGYTGFMVGPPLLGLVSDSFGLRAAFALAALSVVAVPLILVPRMARAR